MDLLKFIQELNIRRRSSADVSDTISRLGSNVEVLKLEFNGLHHIPNVIANCSRLKQLSLAFNEIENIDEDVDTFLFGISSLNLRGNRLHGVPGTLFQHLVVLNLSGNAISTISDIDHISSTPFPLQVLNLSGNALKCLPPFLVGSLRNLSSLDISKNCLKDLPSTITSCKKLKTFHLNDNPLEFGVLERLCSLTDFDTLNLSNLQPSAIHVSTISWIPYSLTSLINLTHINLSSNRLTTLPPVVCRLPALKHLDLRDNLINNLEVILFAASDFPYHLEYLDLSENLLEECVFEHLRTFKYLRVLKLRKNKIHELPKFWPWKLLRHLNINSNRLTYIGSSSALKLKTLLFLDISDNPFKLGGIPVSLKELPDLKADLKYMAKRRRLSIANMKSSLQEIRHLDFVAIREGEGDHASIMNIETLSEHTYEQILQKLETTPLYDLKDHRSSSLTSSERANVLHKISRVLPDTPENSPIPSASTPNYIISKNLQRKTLVMSFHKIFPDVLLTFSGVATFRIDEVPIIIETEVFEDNHCYLILDSRENDSDRVYLWIGSNAKPDKKARAAIFSLGLKSFVSSEHDIRRMEQGEETESFLELYESFTVVHGKDFIPPSSAPKTMSTKKIQVFSIGDKIRKIAPSQNSFASDLNLIVIKDETPLLWIGPNSKKSSEIQARLLAFDLAGRKVETCGFVDKEFISSLPEHIADADYKEKNSVLFEIVITDNSIKLIQPLYSPLNKLSSLYLNTKSVYILDTSVDVFTWSGKGASVNVKTILPYVADHILKFYGRPSWATVSNEIEDLESAWFKMQFHSWDKKTLAFDKKVNKKIFKFTHEYGTLFCSPFRSKFDENWIKSIDEAFKKQVLSNISIMEYHRDKTIPVALTDNLSLDSSVSYVILCDYHNLNYVYAKSIVYFLEGSESSDYIKAKFNLETSIFRGDAEKIDIIWIQQNEEPLLLLYHLPIVSLYNLDRRLMNSTTKIVIKIKEERIGLKTFTRFTNIESSGIVPAAQNMYLVIENCNSEIDSQRWLWLGQPLPTQEEKDLIATCGDHFQFKLSECVTVHREYEPEEFKETLDMPCSFWSSQIWKNWNPRYFLLTVGGDRVKVEERSEFKVSNLKSNEASIMDPIGMFLDVSENHLDIPIYWYYKKEMNSLVFEIKEIAYLYATHWSDVNGIKGLRPVLEVREK